MQLLEDKDLLNYDGMGKRISALRKRVQELLENRVSTSSEPEIKIVEKVVEKIVEVSVESEASENTDKLLQENLMLKKQIADREKTIKELDFKLEMFKLAKSLREGAGISTKSDELKKIINEYIKEIDKSIASLNID